MFGSKINSSEAPQKISPRAVQQLKTTMVETSRASSSNLGTKTPKNSSPKVISRGFPKTPAYEKKHPSKISELESQISQLQEELKNTKEKLTFSESLKIQAEKNEDELKKKLLASSLELKESQKKLSDLSPFEESHKTSLEKSSKARDEALERAESIKEELESAIKTIETLELKSINTEKAFDCVNSELDESRANVTFLEGVVKKLKSDKFENSENEKIDELALLKSALEHEKIKYNEERINSILMIDSLNETAEFTKASFSVREAELEASLCKAKADVEELKALLIDKENENQAFPEIEMRILKEEIEILKANLMDKETESQNIAEENEMLKMKLNEERVTREGKVAEQLAEVQAANAEMEEELRRLKVQADQWRKAAEVAAAMVANCKDGKFVERTSSLDSSYMGKLGSPFGGDIDDEMKKKNGNVLKKFGVLWKKPQK